MWQDISVVAVLAVTAVAVAVHYATTLMRYVPRCITNGQVFSTDLKLSILSVRSSRESSNKFWAIGPTTQNARRPNLLRWCQGTNSSRQLADHRRWWLETSGVRMQQSARYWGARFWR